MKTKEELVNTYLKYSSDIIEEIFNKIIDKLENLGFKKIGYNCDYSGFKQYGYVSFNRNSNIQTCNFVNAEEKEIKVSDILGEETKFEVGKWYSFYWNWSSGYNCIGKVCQVGNSVRTAIHFDNYTSNNSPGKLFTDGRTIYLAEIENIKELNLEEIQQYLPDGHPDKIVEGNLIEIKKMKEYVNTPTEEQFLFVISKLSYEAVGWTWRGKETCINLQKESYSHPEAFEKNNYYTFQKWLDLNDYTFEEGPKEKFKIGDYVISLIDTFYGREKGDLLLITGEDSYIIIATNRTELFSDTIASDEVVRSLRKATTAEIMAVTKPKEKPFEFNKWYKFNNVDGLFFIQSENTGYGFRSNHVNYWFTNNGDFKWNRDGLELATNSEVKKRLLSYAKEKYPVGTKFKELNVPYSLKEFNEAEFDYYPEQDQLTCGQSIYIKGKWAEVISTPEVKEVKEMQLSDLKNPIFNVGDRVRVIADSLREFNSSWTKGNNTNYKKGYIGTVSSSISSNKKEVNIWCYLEDHSLAISCNLLELVESSESSKSKKIDRNVYYEVETQKQYNEILDWLESNGEQVNKGYGIIDPWKYICFENGEWGLNTKVKSQLSKAEFQFKGKSEKQPIKTGGGLREQILQNQYQYEYKTIDSSSVWETLMNPPTQNSTINLKQEPIKLLSFEEDDVVLFKTNSVKISNKQLIIND